MTTDTNKRLAPTRDVFDAALRTLSDVLERAALWLRSTQEHRTQSRGRIAPLQSVAADRIEQLDAAVERGDVTLDEVRSLREGYERVRSREQSGLPPLDLTY